MARLSEYDFELCKKVCKRVSEGETIKAVLASKKEYPDFTTWCRWRRENDELHHLYTRSIQDKAESVDCRIDEIMYKLETGELEPAQARVLIDTLKWKAAKYYPKMFGDKQQIDHTSDGEKINIPVAQWVNNTEKGAENMDNFGKE